MARKLLTIIESDRLGPRSERFKSLDNGSADLLGSLSVNFGHHCVAAFSLNQSDDGVLVRCPNDGIAFPVTDMSASLNRFGALSNRASIWDLPSSIMATGIALALLFLATQGVP